MEKQGIRVDAERMAVRAFSLLRERPDLATPAAVAEAYFRRALLLAEWVRNFDHLVMLADLPVSTATCVEADGTFCEALHHPGLVFERLARGVRLDDLVDDQRLTMRALVDSALATDPAHGRALRLALRDAATRGQWDRFESLVVRARAHAPQAAELLIAALTAHEMQHRHDRASLVYDTICTRMSAETRARFEGLAFIANPRTAERLRGDDLVTYGEAVWALSDPLYLTPTNERRVAHYARVYLASLLFGDALGSVEGRDTDQGRLLVRYGYPAYWFVVKADRALELTSAQSQAMAQLQACASQPTEMVGGYAVPLACTGWLIDPSGVIGQNMDGGGRWTFWFYDSTAVPLIFERGLGNQVAHHKFETRSEEIAEALSREVASSYDLPFRPAEMRALVTRFPRPGAPVVELHARFARDSTLTEDSIELGYFVHDRTTGTLVRRGRAQGPGDQEKALSANVTTPWGRLTLSVEGRTFPSGAAVQLQSTIDLEPPHPDTLVVSDVLLGDSADAPDAVTSRREVRFHARADSVFRAGAPLAIYWETYGLGTADTVTPAVEQTVRYRVRLRVQDAGGRPVSATVVRAIGQALGWRQANDLSLEWDIRRPLGGRMASELLLLNAPTDTGRYRIVVEVTDLADGRVGRRERVIAVLPSSSHP
jgi:GWxTD domain-containing protein